MLSQANCGVLIEPDSLDEYFGNYLPYLSKTLNSASAYAQQCYSNDTLNQVCSVYTQKRLPIQIENNISCPFPGRDVCLKDFGNLRLDTGLLDSHTHFGINSKPESRFQYRRTSECAILQTKSYTEIDTSEPFSRQNATLNLIYGGRPSIDGVLDDNITYQTFTASPLLPTNFADYTLESVSR